MQCAICASTITRAKSQIRNGSFRKTCSNICRYKLVSKTLAGHSVSNSTIEAVIKANKLRDPPMKGRKHSTESKQKMRQSALGRTMSDETKQKMSRHFKHKYKQQPHPMREIFDVIKAAYNVGEKSPSTYKFTTSQRKRLLANTCFHCGDSEHLELDHIIPWFAGGANVDENAQTLCHQCNVDKIWTDVEKFKP